MTKVKREAVDKVGRCWAPPPPLRAQSVQKTLHLWGASTPPSAFASTLIMRVLAAASTIFFIMTPAMRGASTSV